MILVDIFFGVWFFIHLFHKTGRPRNKSEDTVGLQMLNSAAHEFRLGAPYIALGRGRPKASSLAKMCPEAFTFLAGSVSQSVSQCVRESGDWPL